MTYVPIAITSSTISSALIRNLLRLLEEYQISNTYITIQDRENDASYPLYTLFIPTLSKKYTDNKRTTVSVPVSVNIDFDALPGNGDWQKTDEMYEALDKGLIDEKTNLRQAGLIYDGSEVLSAEPIDVNGQQVFSKTVRFEFRICL